MLAQIKKNLLYTLTNVEFAVSREKANALFALMADDGSFTDLKYNEEDPNAWCWTGHMSRLAQLATASTVSECPEQRSKVLSSFDYFAKEHRHNNNWWHNDIGLPMHCSRFYLCMEDYLSDAQKQTLIRYVEQGSIALRPNVLNLWFGANLMWGVINTVYHAVIAEDISLMKEALQAASKELQFHAGSEGIQNDFSFFQHQTQFYTGGYGRSFITDFSVLVYALQGTDYQFDAKELGILGAYIIYGARFCIRNRSYDFLTVGREIARPDGVDADVIRKSLLLLLKVEEMPCRDVMQEQLASFCAEGYAPKGNRFFPESNYYVARNVTYHIGCRGTSPLRSMGESINGENMLSANLYAGGATCIMIDGDEYRNISPLWDYAHVPGTTAPNDTDEELLQKICLWHGKNADNTYCRGVSHNNYGLLYQDLTFNGVTGVISRFFIDDVMIALGAGLSCDSDHNMTTTLNQCRQYDEKILTEADGLPANTVYQGRVAYVSLDEQPITVESEEREGGWSRVNVLNRESAKEKICTFYVDHGVRPEAASYAYLVIPAVSANGAAERIREVTEKVAVLRNDDHVQAIRYQDKVFCVFHKNDTLQISLYDKLIGSAPSAFIF